MTKSTSIVLPLLLAFVLSACSAGQQNVPSFTVKVDAISSRGSVQKETYILLPRNKEVPVEDLQYREFASYIHRALRARGYVPVMTVEGEADLAIFLAYGIGDPQEDLSAHSISMPISGMTTSHTRVASVTTYLRFVVLEAVSYTAYKSTGKYMPVWKTAVTSRGTSSDLREVVPILVAGAAEYFGTNTGKQVTVVLNEDDDKVAAIKTNHPSD